MSAKYASIGDNLTSFILIYIWLWWFNEMVHFVYDLAGSHGLVSLETLATSNIDGEYGS